MQRNTEKYREIQRNTENTEKFREIQINADKFRESLTEI